LVGFSGGKSISNEIGFQTVRLRKAFHNQAFLLVFES
jgi:hypothetical protein